MTEFDKLMQSAWQTARPPADGAALAASVHRTRSHRRLRRCLEIALTLAGIALLARPLFGAATTPAYWLVMPFFVAYLPTIWWLLLRNTQPSPVDAAQSVRTYAHSRLTQLRAGLRELRIARIAAIALLAYAIIGAISAFAFGDPAWQAPARDLLVYAAICALGTLWLSRWQGRRRLREYRAMRRLA
ncbi:hypothetical protein V3391_05100 [Luteimonas sp. SMYT11W]|uniref:Integral membrane protein n=1 Tax=Luteimonas flava TaxID=3115822 RepID=A0ABU7WCJ3_9GAMM